MSPSAFRRQLGQLVMLGFDGFQIPPELRSLAREFDIGGLVLFKRNVGSPAQVAFVLAAGMTGCDGKYSESMAQPTGAPCPANHAGFKEGEVTSADVKACLGKPNYVDYNPDGRYVYQYYDTDRNSYTYLFMSNGKLAEIRAWKK